MYQLNLKISRAEFFGLLSFCTAIQFKVSMAHANSDISFNENERNIWHYAFSLNPRKQEAWASKTYNKLYNFSIPKEIALSIAVEMLNKPIDNQQQMFLNKIHQQLVNSNIEISKPIIIN